MHKIGTRVTVKALDPTRPIGTIAGYGQYDVQAHADAIRADRPLDSDVEPCYLVVLDHGEYVFAGTTQILVSTIVISADHLIPVACQHTETRNACGMRVCNSGCAVYCADCGTPVRPVTFPGTDK